MTTVRATGADVGTRVAVAVGAAVGIPVDVGNGISAGPGGGEGVRVGLGAGFGEEVGEGCWHAINNKPTITEVIATLGSAVAFIEVLLSEVSYTNSFGLY